MPLPLFHRNFIHLLLFTFLSASSMAQSGEKPFENSRFDTIEGFSVHYRVWNGNLEHPKGKILFIHGYAGSTFCFRNLYDTLEALGYKVIAVDIPGAGYSSRSLDFNHSNSHRGRFLWKLLDHIDAKDSTGWIIVGHSMGGGAAEAMAILRPGQTDCLILIAGTLFRKTNNVGNTFLFMVRQKQVKKILVSYADKHIITYKRFYKLLKSGYGRIPDSTEVMGYFKPLEQEGSAEALINIYVNNREREDLDARELSTVPVYAIWGTRDKWIPLRSARIYFGAFPIFGLVKIKGAGHMPMETHIKQFLPPFLQLID